MTTTTLCMLLFMSALLAVSNSIAVKIEAIAQSLEIEPKFTERLASVKGKVVIGGLFSVYESDDFVHSTTNGESDLGYTCCDDQHSVTLFAAEQAEALIHAVELINESKLLRNITVVYDIWDACEAQEESSNNETNKETSLLMASDALAVSVIVAPYCTVFKSSKWVRKLTKLHSNLGSKRMLSRLARFRDNPMSLVVGHGRPFDFSSGIDGKANRLVALQQVCEMQAKAVFNLLEKAGWCDLTFIASDDRCGFWAIQKFHEKVKYLPSHCLYNTKYVHEEKASEDRPDEFNLQDVLNSVEYVRDHMDGNMIWSPVDKTRKSTIAVLSSISYALSVLENIRDNPISTSLTIILGDLWGDRHNVDNLYSVIRNLTLQGHSVYGLRVGSNSTDKFHSYMESIRSNSYQLLRNRWLREYWENLFKCNISMGTCKDTNRLYYGSRPILRNYKASLIMDAVYAIALYAKNISERYPKWGPLKFSKQDFNRFMPGHALNVPNDWTGNMVTLERASDGLDVIQLFKWTYEIVQLKSGGTLNTLKSNLCGKWTLEDPHNGEGKLRLFRSVSSRKQKALPLVSSSTINLTTLSPSENCNNKELHPMEVLASVIAFLLFVIFIVYAAMLQFDVQRLHSAICSVSRITLAVDTLASTSIGFWVISSGVAFSCDHQTADFVVNLLNTVCYSVIFLRLLSKKFERPVIGFCLRRIGFFVLVGFQAAISAFSHFVFTSEHKGQSQISYCSEERQKPLSVVSYCYSVVLLIAAVLIYLFNQCRSQESRTVVLINSSTAVIVGSLYVMSVSVFLLSRDCVLHGRFLVVISLYPALVCVTMTIVFTAVYGCKLCCRDVNENEPDMERDVNENVAEIQTMPQAHSEPNEYVSVTGLQSRTATVEYEL